jgi:signal transduction histidine kinase
VAVYAAEILQVISDLLINALDALPENGVLSLWPRKTQAHILLLIAVNGHGIPEEHRNKMLKPFFDHEGRSREWVGPGGFKGNCGTSSRQNLDVHQCASASLRYFA